MEFREFSAKTVDEAITKASLEYETSSENLEIQVISEGKTGFLGFGSKPAIIKAAKKETKDTLPEEPAEKNPVEKKKEKKDIKPEQPRTSRREETKSEPRKEIKRESPKKEEQKKETFKKENSQENKVQQPAEERKIVARSDEEIAAIKADAEKFLNGVFRAMDLEVEIKMEYKAEEGNLDIEFTGSDMGILIGKRGQTLDSLQYLTSLVVNKGKSNYIRVKLDTEDYRKRRKETLENLARGIAYKVRKTRKPVILEPMNPYERRIIHSALQGNKFVETVSEGEEPYRHVVVKLKRN